MCLWSPQTRPLITRSECVKPKRSWNWFWAQDQCHGSQIPGLDKVNTMQKHAIHSYHLNVEFYLFKICSAKPHPHTTYIIGDHLLFEMMKVSSTSPMLRNFRSIRIKYLFSYQWYSGWSPCKIVIAFFRCGSGARVSKNLGGLIECLPINLLTIIWSFNTKHILLQRILTLEMIAGLTSKFLSCPESHWLASWLLFVSRYYLCCLLLNFLFLHSLFISVTFRSKTNKQTRSRSYLSADTRRHYSYLANRRLGSYHLHMW